MPTITHRESFNGFDAKVDRLKLRPLTDEIEHAVTAFELRIAETKHANGTRQIRRLIDAGFLACGGWEKLTVGGIDWKKTNAQHLTLGVEVQVSGRSDLLAVDLLHLREELTNGTVDAGVIVVPDDFLSRFLTDRTPNLRTALRHIQGENRELPVQVLAFRHDGPGPALAKMRTNLGTH